MGTCFSAIVPRSVFGTPRGRGRVSPEGSTHPSLEVDSLKKDSQVHGLNNEGYQVDSLKKESQVHGLNNEGYQVDSLKKESQGDRPGLKRDGQVDDVKKDAPTMKRRALLIGITYSNAKLWSQLEGPHKDVDQYQELLFCA